MLVARAAGLLEIPNDVSLPSITDSTMVWQPVANTLDLGQAAVGFLSDGRYEPAWLFGIGQNYQAGMSYGETVTRAVMGSDLVTGVGVTSYDLTSSAMQGDWGGVAEGTGGLVGSTSGGGTGSLSYAY